MNELRAARTTAWIHAGQDSLVKLKNLKMRRKEHQKKKINIARITFQSFKK